MAKIDARAEKVSALMKTIGAARIQRQYIGDESEGWSDITPYEFLHLTEWAGLYKPGTAFDAMLSTTPAVARLSPWACFRIVDAKGSPITARVAARFFGSDAHAAFKGEA